MKKTILSAACLAAFSCNTMAAEGWKGNVEVGFVLTDGNSKTQSTNVKSAISKESKNWKNEAKLEALNVKGEVDNKTTRLSERYAGSGQSSYKYNEVSYSFIQADGEHDPFSGFAYQVNSSIGYGHKVINKAATTLSLEAGPGFRQTRLRGEDDSKDDFAVRLAAKFAHNISKTSVFTEDFDVVVADGDSISKSVTAVTAQVVGGISMKTSLTLRHNSAVEDPVEKLDSELGITLVYSF